MTDTVHTTIAHLEGHALYEGAVNWSACSAVAIESAIAGREGRIPDAGNARALWAEMKANAETTGNGTGANLPDCLWALQQRGYHHLDVRYASGAGGLDALHQLLKDAGVAGDPVILLVTNGQALPDNERGVQGHLVLSAGIDSQRGYLLLNGDTQTAIRGQASYSKWPQCSNVPTNWATWATLAAAQPYAAIRVQSNTPTSTTTVTPIGVVTTSSVTPPQVAQALAAVEQASVALQTAQAALKAL